MLNDRLEEGVHPVPRVGGEVPHEPAVQPRAVQDGEMRLLVARPEVDEEIERRVQGVVGAGVRAVDLVDDHDRAKTEPQGAHQHVAGLRHRPLVGVHEEQDRVDHREHPLDLAGEIGVPGGVYDVDVVPVPVDRAVLGADRDAALALEVVVVHEALGDLLVVAERPGGAEHRIDQGRLPVIDMGDDRHVAYTVDRCHAARHLDKRRPGSALRGPSRQMIAAR